MLNKKAADAESGGDGGSDETIGFGQSKGGSQLSVHEADYNLRKDRSEDAGNDRVVHVKYALSDARIVIRMRHFASFKILSLSEQPTISSLPIYLPKHILHISQSYQG